MNVLVIGGGHGAAASLRAALLYTDSVAAIVTTADDGGSSGRLAAELGVPPMGDIRNCLAALAPDSEVLSTFQHRFGSGKLEGHVVGNLVIAGAVQEGFNFIEAIQQSARMLGSRGRVVPPTLDPIRLVAEIDGKWVEGQVAVATAKGHLSFVALDPSNPKPYQGALDLIDWADQIILGPGSLFTSVIPSLLVPELREAFAGSTATRILVCNLASPPGETSGFDATEHLAALHQHIGEGTVDVVVAHSGRSPVTRSHVVQVDSSELEAMGVQLVTCDLLPDTGAPRHDPKRLADCLSSIVKRRVA